MDDTTDSDHEGEGNEYQPTATRLSRMRASASFTPGTRRGSLRGSALPDATPEQVQTVATFLHTTRTTGSTPSLATLQNANLLSKSTLTTPSDLRNSATSVSYVMWTTTWDRQLRNADEQTRRQPRSAPIVANIPAALHDEQMKTFKLQVLPGFLCMLSVSFSSTQIKHIADIVAPSLTEIQRRTQPNTDASSSTEPVSLSTGTATAPAAQPQPPCIGRIAKAKRAFANAQEDAETVPLALSRPRRG